MSSTYHQGGELVYGRDGNLTWSALEEVVGALEGGSALAFSSGLAAIAAVMETMPVPGRVVVAGDAYSGTRRFLADVAERGRLRFRNVDIADTSATLEACAEVSQGPSRASGRDSEFGSLGLLWLESPTNPMLAVADLPRLVEGAHDIGMDVVVDNTFACPHLQRPLELGADAVVHSATKVLSGHSDVIMGLVATKRRDVLAALARRRSLHGAVPGPWEAWLVLRGIRTLALRVERASANAGDLARRLASHPAVSKVRYPGLPSDPGYALACAQMEGFGSMVAFELAGRAGAEAEMAEAFVTRLRLLTAATSLGGVETLVERRARWEAENSVPPGLLRMSVGIEDVEDLWADLEQALSV